MHPATPALKKIEFVGFDGAVLTVVFTSDPGVPSASAVWYSAPFEAPRSWYRIPIVFVVGSTSTHGNHWSPAPASTRLGEVHVAPPSPDAMTNTSMFVTGFSESCIPFRLSLKTSNSRPFGAATMFPAELTRTW
jgi:hypothetical protein